MPETGEVVEVEKPGNMSAGGTLVTIWFKGVLPNSSVSGNAVGSEPASFDCSKGDCCEAGAARGGKKGEMSSDGTDIVRSSAAETGALSGEPCSDLVRRGGPKKDGGGGGCC